MLVLNKFYLSCFLSSIGDRLWYFALSMYFVTINDNNLLMTALNGFVCNLFSILLGAQIGIWIDQANSRLNVIRWSLFLQNTSVAINCVIVSIVLIFKNSILTTWDGTLIYVFQSVMIIFNVLSNFGSTATKISIEKDWIIVIAEHIDKSSRPETNEIVVHEQHTDNTRRVALTLTKINATVRRIDLITGVNAPLLAGIIMSTLSFSTTFNGTIISAMFFAIWNLISYGIEFFILKSIYDQVPTLKKKVKRLKQKSKLCTPAINLYKGWSDYFNQGSSLLPSLALSVLYLTTLSFDSITLGYAKSQNLTELFIAIFQGIGSLTGVLGTFAFELLRNKCKIFLPTLGVYGSVYQLIFLFCCFVAIWLPGSPFELANGHYLANCNQTIGLVNETTLNKKFSTYFFQSDCNSFVSILTLLSAMALSRFGLWLTDLVINQIIQENVDEKERGVVGGVQSSICRIFDLIKFVSVMFLSDITKYGYLVIISISAVFVAFCLYLIYAIKQIVNKYSQVPTESGPFRKSMIEMKVINSQDEATEDVVVNNEDDSFNENISNDPKV